MSKRIEQMLEVIEEVREKFQNQSRQSVSRMRVIAVTSVADRRGITNQTVLDKFIRQLQPDIKVAADFDKFFENRLVHDSDELKNIILKHKSDLRDVELINNAFYKAPESHILLAQGFGYDPSEESFKEGKVQLRLHLTKERNRSLVIRAKEIWNREQSGRVRCSICSFSFPETYGKVGEGFIEAHHTQAISSLAPDTIISMADLVPVCSNCHSMLHRHRPWLTVEQLHTIFQSKGNRNVRHCI
ncbi:hypothetical protein ES703_82496 [subsurface metagenome]